MIILRYIFFISLFLFSFSAHSVTVSARGKFNPVDHEAFSSMPTDILMEKGSAFLKSAHTEPDSALMCFSIIANRYETNPAKIDPEVTISALINLGYLWRESYYDYGRSYSALTKALKISKEKGLTSHLPHIYMGMACVLQYVDIGQSPIDSPPILFSKALEASISSNNNSLVQYAVINLCETALDQGLSDIVCHDLDLIRKYDFNSPGDKKDPVLNMDYTLCFLRALELMATEDYDGMVQEFDRAIDLSPNDNVTEEKLRLLALKMKIKTLRLSSRSNEVPALLDSMLSFSNERQFQEYILFALKGLSDYYSSVNNLDLAHTYDYRYLHVKDSLQELNNITRVKDIAFISGLEEAQDNVKKISAKKRQNETIAICGAIVAVIVILALVLHIMNQRKLYEANLSLFNRLQDDLRQNDDSAKTDQTSSDLAPSPAGGISAEKAHEIFDKVKKVLMSSDEIYSDNFSLRILSEMIRESPHHVSAAINFCSGSNFKTLLLDYRLREACRRLSDHDSYQSQTIESIALGLGFKSRTYFNTVFKKHTGLTPAVYMNLSKMKERKDSLSHTDEEE